MKEIERLQKWYFSQCDGDWEHEFGVFVENLDNPGWLVKIDLEDTDMEDKIFVSVLDERDERNWVQCEVKEKKFEAMGGPFNLGEIFRIFLDWAEASSD